MVDAANDRSTWNYADRDFYRDQQKARERWERLVATTTWWPGSSLGVESYARGVPADRARYGRYLRPPRSITVVHRRGLAPQHPDLLTPEVMCSMLRQQLRQVAVHEADEWLVIAGERPFDPHKSWRP